jgi:hypothetical protein
MSENTKETNEKPPADSHKSESLCENSPDSPPSVEPAANGREIVPCASCGSTAPADEQGKCLGVPGNKCRRTRVGSSLASKHDGRAKLTAEDLNARDALVSRLLAERGGRANLDVVSQLRIEDYATAQIQLGKVTRRLEMLGAVSTAGNKRSSLVDTYNLFSARVERLAAELPAPRVSPIAPTSADRRGIELMPTSALVLAKALITRLIDGEELSDFERGQLAVLRGAAQGELLLRPDAPVRRPTITQQESTSLPVTEPEPTASEPAQQEPAPTPAPAPCKWCYRHPCIGNQHPAYYQTHPEAAKKRDDAAFRARYGLDPMPNIPPMPPVTPPPATDEARRAADIRKSLGWNLGVLNEATNYKRERE